jgi:hypothetical protein
MNVFRQSLPALRRAAGAGRAGGVRHMSGHGTQEEAVAEMNRWRTISYGVVPLVFGLTAYTLSTASHSHGEEKIGYEYLHLRTKRWPWEGDNGLFERPPHKAHH